MRNYRLLDTIKNDQGTLQITSSDPATYLTSVTMGREGERLLISASYGPVELALRLNLGEFQRQIATLSPLPGMTTTRSVGSGNAHVEVGISEDGGLVLRPALVNDATGHIIINLVTTKEVFSQLTEWLNR